MSPAPPPSLVKLPRIRALCVGYRPPDSPLSILGSLPRIRALCVGYRPPDSPLSTLGSFTGTLQAITLVEIRDFSH